MFAQALAIFGTGIVASLSPCVYPMIPITLGFLGKQAQSGNRSNIFLYLAGQTLAFVALGVVAVKLGETFGFSSETPTVNYLIGAFLIVAGYFSYRGRLPRIFDKWNAKAAGASSSSGVGAIGSFLFGVSAALIASPCTSPLLGGVLALMASSGSLLVGSFLMLMYALGFSLVFLVLGLGAVKVSQLPKAGNWMSRIHKASSVLLVIAGVYFLWQGTQL